MKASELKQYILEMFSASPEVESISGIVNAMSEGAEENVYEAQVHAACEQLVAEGVLQNAGRQGYEATVAFMEENGHEVAER